MESHWIGDCIGSIEYIRHKSCPRVSRGLSGATEKASDIRANNKALSSDARINCRTVAIKLCSEHFNHARDRPRRNSMRGDGSNWMGASERIRDTPTIAGHQSDAAATMSALIDGRLSLSHLEDERLDYIPNTFCGGEDDVFANKPQRRHSHRCPLGSILNMNRLPRPIRSVASHTCAHSLSLSFAAIDRWQTKHFRRPFVRQRGRRLLSGRCKLRMLIRDRIRLALATDLGEPAKGFLPFQSLDSIKQH